MNSLDDLLNEFQERAKGAVSSNKSLWEGEMDDMYSVDIHIWRKPGMGNSLQTIAGNQVSIMTATASYLNTLLSKGIITVKQLDDLVKAVKEVHHEGK